MSPKSFKRTQATLTVLTAIISSWMTPLHAQNVSHGISAAWLKVIQNDEGNTTNSVSITTPVSINQFSVRDGSNRGDYNVQIGLGSSDDVDSGVLIGCIAENGRDNGETNYPGYNYCISSIDYSRTGGNAGSYYIPVFNAPTGDEYNVNIAAAFFPYTNWIGGFARNSGTTNGGANDLFTGSPGLVLGTHFIDNGSGISTVNLTSLGINSQINGVLLVTHGKNEANYALSQANANGTWTIFVKDSASNQEVNEQDPVAFVFIPKTNSFVISGRFMGDGMPQMFSGVTPQFSVTNTSVGQWRLTIPGYSPSNGVLIISGEGGLNYNQDNIVSYQPDGDGWIIQSRDLPGNPPGLQIPVGQPVASFVFVPAAVTATVVSPIDQAQNQPVSPVLKVNVTNAVSGNLTVKFYGRVATTSSVEDFAIALLPDTQFYSDSAHGALPAMWYAQMEWIVTNRVAQNIVYVAQLGDCVDHGDNNGGNPAAEWKVATNAMYRLENPVRTLIATGIPYGVAVGNHDESPNGDSTGTTTYYNQYFGINHFTGKPYYAGHYGTNNNNHYDFFSAGGMDFIVVYLQYDNTLNTNYLNWANEVVSANPNRRAIIVTHNFGNTATPVKFSAQGAAIYNAIKTNSNVFLMVSGHVTGESSRVDTFNGNTIRTYVQDFQGWTNGGNGFLRMLYFSPANNQVLGQTYSPYTGEYETDANSEFFFPYNMQSSVGTTNVLPFNLIGTVSNVPPGDVAEVTWPGRLKNTAYEWYVVVTDPSNNTTTGPAWRFSTAPNSAPVVSNQVMNIIGDAPTNLTLTAFDVNGDPLTFETNSAPLHGYNVNFNTNSGAITYVPIYGYRGFDRFTYRASDGVFTSSWVTLNLNIAAPADTNSNGIPDAWEATYGITDPNADDDGDGQSNFNEYFANTNPTNAASRLNISQATRAANGHVTLVWPSVGGVRYRVQYSNGGANGTFTGVFTDIVRSQQVELDASPYGSSSTQNFIDDFTLTGGGGNGVRYYRIKIVQ